MDICSYSFTYACVWHCIQIWPAHQIRKSAYIFMSVSRCIEGFIWTYAWMHLHMPVCDIVYIYDLLIKFRKCWDSQLWLRVGTKIQKVTWIRVYTYKPIYPYRHIHVFVISQTMIQYTAFIRFASDSFHQRYICCVYVTTATPNEQNIQCEHNTI